MLCSSASRASAALIAIFGLAACSGEDLPLEPDSGSDIAAAPAIAAPATEVANLIGNSWSIRANMPTARRGLVTAAVNGVVYAIGGGDASETPVATVEAYNPGSVSFPWKTVTPMPAARWYPNGVGVINGKIYVAGGMNAALSPTRSLYVYNPATNTWTTKARMPVASAIGAAGVIGGKLYVIATPNPESATRSRLFRYDPATNTWTERRSAPDRLVGAVAGVLNGRLYAAGGINVQDAPMNTLRVYNPATDTWTTKAPMPSARSMAAGRVISGKFFVVGGSTGSGFSAQTLVYDPVSNTWAPQMSMPTARHSAAAEVVNGLLYVLGGATQAAGAITTNEVYFP